MNVENGNESRKTCDVTPLSGHEITIRELFCLSVGGDYLSMGRIQLLA